MSPVSIVNEAFAYLGESPIVSLDDDTKTAAMAKGLYATAKASVLRMHRWSCAVKRKNLAELTTTLDTPFPYAYSLPSDYVHLIDLYTNDINVKSLSVDGIDVEQRYLIENGTVQAFDSPLQMRYVFDVPEAQMDPLLASTLSAYLAWQMAYALTGSGQHEVRCSQRFATMINEARTANQIELPRKIITATQLARARRG
jgi:hypothetical protein